MKFSQRDHTYLTFPGPYPSNWSLHTWKFALFLLLLLLLTRASFNLSYLLFCWGGVCLLFFLISWKLFPSSSISCFLFRFVSEANHLFIGIVRMTGYFLTLSNWSQHFWLLETFAYDPQVTVFSFVISVILMKYLFEPRSGFAHETQVWVQL